MFKLCKAYIIAVLKSIKYALISSSWVFNPNESVARNNGDRDMWFLSMPCAISTVIFHLCMKLSLLYSSSSRHSHLWEISNLWFGGLKKRIWFKFNSSASSLLKTLQSLSKLLWGPSFSKSISKTPVSSLIHQIDKLDNGSCHRWEPLGTLSQNYQLLTWLH